MLKKLMISTILMAIVGAAFARIPPIQRNANLRLLVKASTPSLMPQAPDISAISYTLFDPITHTKIASKNADKRLDPASLTKLLTLYIAFDAIEADQIHLSDNVRVSKRAWETKGSKMFLNQGEHVSVSNLIQGIIVTSGNDATVALAEHIAGSEIAFVSLMNQTAKVLQMDASHFNNATGMPNPDHYSTANDLAKLTQALIENFPQYYDRFKQKWMMHNHIKQPNRNRLLWRDTHTDGLKTGHTDRAGYCLITSSKHHDMRLASVILGAPSDADRFSDAQILYGFGFRFFRSKLIMQANRPIAQLKVFKGISNDVAIGVTKDFSALIAASDVKKAKLLITLNQSIEAPIKRNTPVGHAQLMINQYPIATAPLYTLEDISIGSWHHQLTGALTAYFYRLMHDDKPRIFTLG